MAGKKKSKNRRSLYITLVGLTLYFLLIALPIFAILQLAKLPVATIDESTEKSGSDISLAETSVETLKILGSPATTDIDILRLWELTNQERTSNGIVAVQLDALLNQSALDKCNDMVTKNYFAHNAPDGTEPWVFIKKYTTYYKAGENLAFGQRKSDEVHNEWVLSPTHKSNIVEPAYTAVGFAVCKSDDFTGHGQNLVTVQHFVGR